MKKEKMKKEKTVSLLEELFQIGVIIFIGAVSVIMLTGSMVLIQNHNTDIKDMNDVCDVFDGEFTYTTPNKCIIRLEPYEITYNDNTIFLLNKDNQIVYSEQRRII